LGTLQYSALTHDKVVVCSVNPMNVVAIPRDYDFQKMRCCEYKVLEDYTGPLPHNYYDSCQDDDEDDCDEDCDDDINDYEAENDGDGW